MDKGNKGYSVQQNISGVNHRVVGGNIIHGDATFNIQSSGEEKTKPKSAAAVTASSMGKLDSEVEKMLTKHDLMCLKQVFARDMLIWQIEEYLYPTSILGMIYHIRADAFIFFGL